MEDSKIQVLLDKGDFLALIQRNGEKDGLLAKNLHNKWKQINQSNKFKLLDFRLNISEVTVNDDDRVITVGWKIV